MELTCTREQGTRESSKRACETLRTTPWQCHPWGWKIKTTRSSTTPCSFRHSRAALQSMADETTESKTTMSMTPFLLRRALRSVLASILPLLTARSNYGETPSYGRADTNQTGMLSWVPYGSIQQT